ncbi:hypothetical protein [Streptomyces prunicolor]|uniref:hypothetical protein n=1 Tax=Streptomyces prunicolor TaxID=67348 RepID=UPI00037F6FC6|nr:hypothetical protein [Streptomyces prunicolor]
MTTASHKVGQSSSLGLGLEPSRAMASRAAAWRASEISAPATLVLAPSSVPLTWPT